MKNIEQWSIFFEENNISHDQKSIFINYIETLQKNKVPVIFEFEHLSKLLGFERKDFANLVINTRRSYREFFLPKKTGGYRLISSPYFAIAHCQSWIFNNILKNVDVGEYSYAFQKNKNIVDNAKLHLGNNELLKVDIRDFFGSIKINRVISIFKNFGYTNHVSFYLASICCYMGALPQGACTSPIISNIVAKRLDRRISALSNKLNLTYSRYADDIYISGEYIPRNLIGYLDHILRDEGFMINKKKTRLKLKNQKKIITGLSISNSKLRVPKNYKRSFRKDSYFLIKNGVSEFNGERGLVDPLYIDRMIGRANFILLVEPENVFVQKTLEELKSIKLRFM